MMKIKKILSLMIVLILTLVLAVPAFAADMNSGKAPATKGSITINNASAGATYNAYRILDLQSYEDNGTTQRYAYAVNNKWKEFFETDITAKKYVQVDSGNSGAIKWIGGETTADIQEFGKAAKEWAAAHASVTPDYTAATVGGSVESADNQAVDGVAKFENLELGYYLVFADGDGAEAAVALDTTNADVIMREKNEEPAIGKVVDKDTASLGKILHYTIPVVIGGADLEEYTIIDTMSGIKFNQDSLAVKVYEKPGIPVNLNNFTTDGLTEKASWTANKEYTVTAEPYTDAETPYEMRIALKKDALRKLNPGDIVVVSYDAEATKLVVVDNTVKLSYSNGVTTQETPEVSVDTHNFAFNLKKTNGKEALQGAEFKMSEELKGKQTVIRFVNTDGSYKVAVADDVKTTEVIQAGNIKIQGLGAGTYYLEETKAPAGYNKLSKPLIIKIDNKGAVSINRNGESSGQFDSITQSGGEYTVEVINNTGIELPSTGGRGTTVFYIVGALLMAAAVVAFIMKKYMAK